MESLQEVGAHRETIGRLVPLLDAMRSIAEIAWHRAEQASGPLARYAESLQGVLEEVAASLEGQERVALLGIHARTSVTGLLCISSERGLCGAFNDRIVAEVLSQGRSMVADGHQIAYLSLGERGRRLLETAGGPVLYARSLPSLSVPAYVDIEGIALDLVKLAERGVVGRLLVVHNAPVRRFQYGPTIRPLLPPALPAAPRASHRVRIKPAGDAAALLTHLLTERVLVGLYQAVIESAASEQLARMYTMRLAAENARRLVDRLTLEYNMARRNAITAAVLEVAAGYEATAGLAASDAGPALRT
jgi:F-type H+-transporting ATPase subunit gamma